MRIRMPTDIRDRHIKLGLDQPSLAQKVGVSRKWIVEVEKGKPRAEFDLRFRTIDPLGIILTMENEASAKTNAVVPEVDIDSVGAAAREKNDRGTDGSAEYNSIGVASGRVTQATRASTNDAPIFVRLRGRRWVSGAGRRFLGRALPNRSDSQLGPGASHCAAKDRTSFGPA